MTKQARLANLLAAVLSLAPMAALAVALTFTAVRAQPRECEPDCRQWAWSPYHGWMYVQDEYVTCLAVPDARWWEDGSSDCGR